MSSSVKCRYRNCLPNGVPARMKRQCFSLRLVWLSKSVVSWPSVPSLTLPHVALSKWGCTGSFPHTRPRLTCSSPPAVAASGFCICPKNRKFLSLKPNGFREPSWIILTLLIAPSLNSSELQAPYQVFHTTSFDNSLLCLCQREYFQSNSCYIFAF